MLLRKSIPFLILLFCLDFAQVVRASKMSIITFFITNTGLYVTIGVDDKTKPEKTFCIDQSTEPTLTGYPPSFTSDETPIKFLYTFWEKHEKDVLRLLCDDMHKDLPVEVYITTTDKLTAQTEQISQREIITHYLSRYPEEDANVDLTVCNKLTLFEYIFHLEIEKKLPHQDIKIRDILDNMTLIANMASLYYSRVMSTPDAENQQSSDQETDKVKRNSPQEEYAMVAHLTTDICFCRVPQIGNGKDKSNLSWTLFTCNKSPSWKTWNIYKIGLGFREKHLHKLLTSDTMRAVTERFETQDAEKIKGIADKIKLNQLQFETLFCEYQKQNKDDLLSAVYMADVLHNAKHTDLAKTESAYQGAPCMMYLLGREGKSYNVFGDFVADVLCTKGYAGDQFAEKRSKIKTICPEYSSERACDQAMDLIDDVFEVFLDDIISLYFKYNWCMDERDGIKVVDSLVLIGDRINVLQQYASRKKANLAEILLQKLQDPPCVNKLFEKIQARSNEQKSREQFEKDIQTQVIPAIKKILIVPEEEFTSLMHQAVLNHLSEKKQLNALLTLMKVAS